MASTALPDAAVPSMRRALMPIWFSFMGIPFRIWLRGARRPHSSGGGQHFQAHHPGIVQDHCRGIELEADVAALRHRVGVGGLGLTTIGVIDVLPARLTVP